jgi:ABC-type antimicrobial peptide transport system permease subunit
MSARDLLHAATQGISLYRIRSLLTLASFGAGTAAAVALFAITGGARAALLQQIQALGADLVTVRAVGVPARAEPPPLTVADAEVLDQSFGFLRAVAPVRTVESSVLLPDERVTVQVIGTTPAYFALRRLRFARGRAFTAAETADGRNVCVLGAAAARRLTPGADAYGALVKVGGSWCRVVGILAADERELFLPLASTLRDLSGRQALSEIVLRVDESVDPARAAPVIDRALLRRHDGRRHFEVMTAETLLRQQRNARGLLDTLLAIVALLACGLGAVGLASLSWQSVTARTREIAIRRAVGARREEILAQFLLEGMGLAATGGAAGALLGALGSGVAAVLGGWPWLLSAHALLGACAGVVAVGLAATAYPAYRAATLDPVAALRVDA